MTSVLIVEDDPSMRRNLELTIAARGYEVAVTGNGEDALVMAGRQPPDLVLLDLGLPGIGGNTVIERLRAWSSVPIIVLSARDAEADKVAALDLGANDYITKPFGAAELLARVRAALRATDKPIESVRTAEIDIDLVNRVVRRADGVNTRLTPIEWAILEHLCRHAGQLVATRQLLTAVWGHASQSEANSLRVHVTHLRQKIEPDPLHPRLIITEPGSGYRFIE